MTAIAALKNALLAEIPSLRASPFPCREAATGPTISCRRR